ncbi:MAG TPA: hypothetical protein VIX86_04610 [Streptosporangiaceae bacterium]
MSTMTPEAPAPAPARGGGSWLTRRVGPVQGWVYLAGGLVVAGAVAWRYLHPSTSTASTSAAADTTGASQVPQFVNQTYTSVAAPSAPVPPPTQQGPATQPPRTHRKVKVGPQNRDIYRLARSYGMTEHELLALNPDLRKLAGTRRPIPIGTEITV